MWLDSENFDKYRLQACKQRLTAGNRIYHVHQGLIPGYYGHVPGKHFLFVIQQFNELDLLRY